MDAVGEKVADGRREGYNHQYKIQDAFKSAFAVFFFQHPTMLAFQRAMKEKRKRNNVETLLGVREIPCDNEIRELLDVIEPRKFSDVFKGNLRAADKQGALKPFRVLDDGVLIALDGVWYHSSEKVHCAHCLHKDKDGVRTYYHSALAGTIVRPGGSAVLPVMPEMISNKDGNEKQDCERNAAKRWIERHAAEYGWLKPTILGDDLFSNYPFCNEILKKEMSFLLTCKPASHRWLTEIVDNAPLGLKEKRAWNGREHLVHRYRWLEGVEIRDNKETLQINYLSLEITNEEKKKVTYKNSWITDKPVTADTVMHLAACARSRWIDAKTSTTTSLKTTDTIWSIILGMASNMPVKSFAF